MSVHDLQVVVQNISNEQTAIAQASSWLRNHLDSLSPVDVNASVEGRNTRVVFTLHLEEGEVERIKSSEEATYLGPRNE